MTVDIELRCLSVVNRVDALDVRILADIVLPFSTPSRLAMA